MPRPYLIATALLSLSLFACLPQSAPAPATTPNPTTSPLSNSSDSTSLKDTHGCSISLNEHYCPILDRCIDFNQTSCYNSPTQAIQYAASAAQNVHPNTVSVKFTDQTGASAYGSITFQHLPQPLPFLAYNDRGRWVVFHLGDLNFVDCQRLQAYPDFAADFLTTCYNPDTNQSQPRPTPTPPVLAE